MVSQDAAIRSLLDELVDPLALAPVRGVARSLSEITAEYQESFSTRHGPNGVARKFWDVPTEMLHQEIGMLLGSAFVLGQTTLTQTRAIAMRIHRLSSWDLPIPKGRRELLDLGCGKDPESNMSHLAIIDTAANFFKHHHEWPDQESSPAAKRPQPRTIADARVLGFGEDDVAASMHTALRRMGLGDANLVGIADTIQDWRERLARTISQELSILCLKP